MATVKNFNTSYTINGPQVTITGNLTVLGNTTQVNSANTSITDNFFTLNAGETGNGVSTLGTTSGIIIDRGQQPNVYVQWNEATKSWQISDQTGINFGNLISSPLTSNLITNSYAITSPTNVVFGSNIQLNTPVTIPSTPVTNATVVYGSAVGGGTTGIFVLNGQAANQELVTKARALGFSLLL